LLRRAVAELGAAQRRAGAVDPRRLALASHPRAPRPGRAGDPGAHAARTPGASVGAPRRPPRGRRVLVGARMSDRASTPTPRRARKVRRGPILLVVLAAVVAAVVAQQGASSSESATASSLARTGVSVPSSDVASSAWYCAEGTSTPDGRADETVIVASLAPSTVDATITVMPGGNGAPKTRQLRLAPGEETRVKVADILATPEPGVVVETTGGPAAVSHQLQHDGDFAVEP